MDKKMELVNTERMVADAEPVFVENYKDEEQRERIMKVREASLETFGDDEKPLAEYLSKVFGITLWVAYDKKTISWVQQCNDGRFVCIGKTKFDDFADDVGKFYAAYMEQQDDKASLNQFILEVAIINDDGVRLITDSIASELRSKLIDKSKRWTQLGYAERPEKLHIDGIKVIEHIPF